MSLFELKRAASMRKIKYCGIMSKPKLIEMLKTNDKDPSTTGDPEFDEKCKELTSKQLKNISKKSKKEGGHIITRKKQRSLERHKASSVLFF